MSLLESVTNAYNEYMVARDTLSQIESEINSLYHVLEMAPLNGVEMCKIASLLKSALKKRRLAKEEIAVGDAVFQNIKLHEIRRRAEARAQENKRLTLVSKDKWLP